MDVNVKQDLQQNVFMKWQQFTCDIKFKVIL